MKYIKVKLARQLLQLIEGQNIVREWQVSTGRNGVGELMGSGCTPRGWLIIRLKIGQGCPVNTVFIGRRPTGEIWTPTLQQRYPERDWILTRILWLSGLEPGKNRYGQVDTLRRFIYIHGSPDDAPMGVPLSHGCIRMHNHDLMSLFEQITTGTRVLVE